MATSEKDTHGLVKFIGFSGLLALAGIGMAIGKYQATTGQLLNEQQETQAEIVKLDGAVVNVTDELHVQQYRVTEAEKKIDKLEEHK